MNTIRTRNLLLAALLVAALGLGAGLLLAQDEGGNGDEETKSEKTWSGFGRRGFGEHHRFGGRGMPRGFGGPARMMPMAAGLQALLTEATGLEAADLRDALREGESLASLIEAAGGDVEAFIAEVTAQVSAGIGERIGAMVHGERPEGLRDHDKGPRGLAGRGMAMAGGAEVLARLTEVTGLERSELYRALREGNSLASLIEANEGDVDAFIAGAVEAFSARIDEAAAARGLDGERVATLKEGMAERLEALVHAEHPARDEDRAWRGRHRDGNKDDKHKDDDGDKEEDADA